MGFNAVILQVRPSGDALYKSSIFPWSDVLTGEQGIAPPGGFDPLAYFVEGAHSRGMELHAWLNPYRVARNTQTTNGLASNNPARRNPSWTVAHTDGHLYYDPGVPEVLQLILDGVREITDNYAVDGIHFDDYFYPGKTFNDETSYAAHGSAFATKEEWRRDNLNRLIRETNRVTGEKVRFGVAPQAIWANKSNNPLGSDTRGYETYYEQSADTRKWVLEGWVDYIAPQIYWEIGRENSDYAKVLAWWADLAYGTGTDLYVGHATYLMNGNNSRPAWAGVDEIARQHAENAKYPVVKGSMHFRYKLIAEDAAISAAVKSLYSGVSVSVAGDTGLVMPVPSSPIFAVGRPDRNVTFSGNNYYITGSSDPSQKLTVNGTEITGRTSGGFFSYYASLKSGANTFTFEQGGTKITRTVTVPGGGSVTPEPEPMSAAVIRPGVFPDGFDEIRPPGAEISLTCTAPSGAEVSVIIGGQTLKMIPDAANVPSDGKLYPVTYRVSYTFPNVNSGHAPLLTVGTPVYTMTMDGKVSVRAATGSLKLSTSADRFVAEVRGDAAFVFNGASTSGGPAGELARGQTDRVVSQQNGLWVELGCGLWTQSSDVRFLTRDSALLGSVSGAEYRSGEKWDTLTVKTNVNTAATASFDGNKLTFRVFNVNSAPTVSLPSDALIGTAASTFSGGTAVYTLTLSAGTEIDGYYTEPISGGIRLCIKRRPVAKAGSKPLDGFTIMLDAGHGGTDTGAYSPIGAEYAEKYINLYAALKLRNVLQNMGAQVVLTRSSDTTVSLQSRLNLSRSTRPDLFVSLHCNSMGESTNSDSIRGVVVLYREGVQQAFSEHMYEYLQAALNVQGRGVRSQNLYVCRGTWTPTALIEMGFINNPSDYQWLLDNAEQDKLVKAMADGIVEYFR
jgi:uncharacterized lipoprotein YddW (UPF0748 family)/N-acetylmuramoyl-L-alanine amidase